MNNQENDDLIKKINQNIHNNIVYNNKIHSYNIFIENDNKKIRIYYFDILRIVSCFSVILIHVSARYFYLFNIKSNNWKIAYCFNGISRFGVPIFFMISGALFLSKDISFSKIFNRYIRRLLIKLIFWSFIYSIYKNELSNQNIKLIIINFFKGNYHFWYLYVILELYLITPFLREIIKRNLLIILIKLSFFFTFVIPNLNEFNSNYPSLLSTILQIINIKFDFKYIKGYIFYFLFGYYLNNNKLSILKIIFIYICGIISFFFITLILYKFSIKKNTIYIKYFRGLNLHILFYSTSIFMFFKLNLNNYKINNLFKKLSQYTFGIYLIHPLILNKIRIITGDFSSIKLIFRIPLISIIVFIISIIICFLIKLTPIFGNYLI